MADVVTAARTKLAFHKQQVAELEAFLRLYDALSQDAKDGVAIGDSVSAEIVAGNATPQNPVDNLQKSPSRRRGKMKPDAVSDLMARIIREVGHPMTRGEIVTAFEHRDVEIPFEDKGRYIGTIAWRNKGRFENIEGRGYWLRGEPLKHPETEYLDMLKGLEKKVD